MLDTFGLLIRLPESLDHPGWLRTHGLAETGGSAWSDHDRGQRLFVSEENTRELRISVTASTAREAEQRVRVALPPGGELLAGAAPVREGTAA